MMFSVVEFSEINGTKTIAVVHNSWVNENFCYWPPYRNPDKTRKAVETGENFNLSSWSKHPARTLGRYGMCNQI